VGYKNIGKPVDAGREYRKRLLLPDVALQVRVGKNGIS
jgi:hypothetical protein